MAKQAPVFADGEAISHTGDVVSDMLRAQYGNGVDVGGSGLRRQDAGVVTQRIEQSANRDPSTG